MLGGPLQIPWRFAELTAGQALVYCFEGFELDPGRFELRRDGRAVPVEPQVLSLLILLAGNAERLVSRDEIAEKGWHNPGISDATIASRVKSARCFVRSRSAIIAFFSALPPCVTNFLRAVGATTTMFHPLRNAAKRRTPPSSPRATCKARR